MAPGSFSRRTVSQRPGNSGPSTPVRSATTCYAPQRPLKRTGTPPGGANLGRRATAAPARKTSQQGSGVSGALSVPGICQRGSGQPGNLRACRGGPLLELAGLAEAGGEPPGAPAACQRTRASGTGSTLHPGRVAGHGDQLALGRTCPLRSDETTPPGDLGCRTSGSRRRRVHPAAGDR